MIALSAKRGMLQSAFVLLFCRTNTYKTIGFCLNRLDESVLKLNFFKKSQFKVTHFMHISV